MEECTNNAEEEKLAEITSTENENRRKYSSCTLYIALFSMIFTINVGIGTYFVYYKYKNRNKETRAKKVLIIKWHFIIELINGSSHRHKHQKSNVLLF